MEEVTEMSLRRIWMGLGLLGLVASMAVAGTVLAQTPTPPPGQSATANYGQFFLDRLAANLGIPKERLTEALTRARDETADQAVKDGRLSQQQADRLKAQPGVPPFGFGFGFHGEKRGMPGFAFRFEGPVRDAIAGALGMTTQQLNEQLRSGQTLGQLAQGKEQAVRDAIVGAVRPQLDQAVQNGRMTQDQANQILSKIQNMDLNQLGMHPGNKLDLRRGPRLNPNGTPTPRNQSFFGRPGGASL
jgi:hypothetical protein